MAGRPLVLPWDFSTFSGNEPITRMSDEFNAIKAVINDSGAGWSNYSIDTGSANSYVVTLTPPPLAYSSGMMVSFIAANTNSGASSINVNTLGNVSIKNGSGGDLQPGDIVAGSITQLVYASPNFYIVAPASSSLPLPASQFTVSPGPGLSVNISTVGTLLVVGSSLVAGSSTPVNLPLTAPGANTYYATIYYDTNANAFGAAYSVPSGSPVLTQAIMPDFISLIPVAVIPIAAGATSVSSASILDLRQNQYGVLYTNTTYTGNATINCFGAREVVIFASTVSNSPETFTFNNLQVGAKIYFRYANTSGGSNLLKFAGKTPSGTTYTSGFTVFDSGALDMVATGVSVPTGKTLMFQGVSRTTTFMDFIGVSN